MSDFDLLKPTPELTAAIKRDRERIMSEQDKQTEPWALEQIKADAKEDDAFWGSHEFNVAAWDIVRLYTQKKSLLKIVDSQALEIEKLRLAEDRLKPVTEIELKVMFDNIYKPALHDSEVDRNLQMTWHGFLSAARLFGKVTQ